MKLKALTLLFLSTSLIGTLGAPALAHADEEGAALHPFGRVYTDQYFYTQNRTSGNTASSVAQSSASLWLGTDVDGTQFTHGLNGHFLGQLDGFLRSPTHPYDATSSVQLREGYFSYAASGLDVRLGQQIIPWGKSDGVNPTDYFTAKNYTLLNPDDEVRRSGAPSLNLSLTPNEGNSPWTLQTVVQAYDPQTQLLIPDSALPTGLAFSKYPKPPRAFTPEFAEFGVKLACLRNDFDFSISYFRGYNHFAEYVFDPNTSAVNPVNTRQTAVGGDASFTVSNFVFRAESAILMPDNAKATEGLNGLVEPWHWDTVLGVERPFLENFRVQAQLLIRSHFEDANPQNYTSLNPLVTAVQRAVGQANQLILNYQHQNNIGGTLRLAYANEASPWSADVYLIGYFASGQDFLLRPELGYKFFDSLRLLAGIDQYGGEASRPLGALKNQSDVFFEGKYTF